MRSGCGATRTGHAIIDTTSSVDGVETIDWEVAAAITDEITSL
ncbi:MAG: hypothetical protein ACI8RZ_001428 [Myxococcota bacterium]|jgi:hypothetical protein